MLIAAPTAKAAILAEIMVLSLSVAVKALLSPLSLRLLAAR
jgi:hypothetical protein